MKKQLLLAFCSAILCLAQSVWAQKIWDGKIDTEWYWDNASQAEFTITTAEQLAGFAQLVNGGNNFLGKTIKLGANIVLNDTANGKNNSKNIWVPIGSYTNEKNNSPFSGTFDGDGYVVSGVYIDNSNNYQGLFGYVGSGMIKNLGVTASFIKGRSYIGGLVGQNNGTITNSYIVGNVTGGSSVGGLVGNNNGNITNCNATGNVDGSSSIGGLVGSNSGRIANCNAKGNVRSPSMSSIDNSSIGGLVGINNNGIITDCNATVNVTGGKSVGGLVGVNEKGTIKDCYATGNVASTGWGFGGLVGGLVGENQGTITDCYATGNVTGKGNQGNNIGGLVGSNYKTITNCYATGNVTGRDAIGGLVGFSGGEAIGFNVKTTGGGKISNCYATGKIDGSSYVGGLVGKDGGNSIIENSYSTGNVTSSGNYTGGLMGNNGGTIMNCYAIGNVKGNSSVGGLIGENSNKGTITNCYAVGKVLGATSNNAVGGLAGLNNGSLIKKSYYDRQTSGQVDINKGEPKSTVQMKQQATFVEWNFDKIWIINAEKNDGYPYLKSMGVHERVKEEVTGHTESSSGGFNDGYAEGGSSGIGDMLGGMMGGSAGGIGTKAKGSLKAPSARDIDMGSGDGSRSKQEIMQVVNARMPALRKIYNEYLKLKGFSGKVTLKFTIASGGDITDISIVSSTTGYAEFDNAIKNMVATWKWKTIKSGNTTPTIPLSFE